MMSTGYVPHHGKCLPLPGVSRGAIVLSYSCKSVQRQFCTNDLLKSFNFHNTKRMSLVCNVGPNNYKRNPDFSRQQKRSSRGKSKQYQDPEQPDSSEEMDFVSSKNGSLPSLTSNTRPQATATPGLREKEIVELFRKVQAQLRERSAIKEDKKIEAAQKGQSERGTVDSLLKLLRKHSVNQKKKSSSEADFAVDQLEKGDAFEDEQNLNLFGPDDTKPEESHEPDPLPLTRPTSNFRRKSPVPRMKFQPIFSAEDIKSTPSKSRGRRKKSDNSEFEPAVQSEALVLDGADELSLDNQLEASDSVAEETKESSAIDASPDLGSLKLSELRDIAKSRGVKGYSKLKKGELVELLNA